jgi:hypothetical protein
VCSGVTQGSGLAPLLFISLINYLPNILDYLWPMCQDSYHLHVIHLGFIYVNEKKKVADLMFLFDIPNAYKVSPKLLYVVISSNDRGARSKDLFFVL